MDVEKMEQQAQAIKEGKDATNIRSAEEVIEEADEEVPDPEEDVPTPEVGGESMGTETETEKESQDDS